MEAADGVLNDCCLEGGAMPRACLLGGACEWPVPGRLLPITSAAVVATGLEVTVTRPLAG